MSTATVSDIKLTCPNCHSRFRSNRPLLQGRQIQCPHCDQFFRYTAPITAQTPPSSGLSASTAKSRTPRPVPKPSPRPARWRTLGLCGLGLAGVAAFLGFFRVDPSYSYLSSELDKWLAGKANQAEYVVTHEHPNWKLVSYRIGNSLRANVPESRPLAPIQRTILYEALVELKLQDPQGQQHDSVIKCFVYECISKSNVDSGTTTSYDLDVLKL